MRRDTTDRAHGGSSDDDERAMIDRVRKLLAMAERSPHPEEADAFSRKAAEIIARHRLDPARLRERVRTGELEVRDVPLGRGAYVRARLALLCAVATAGGCQVVFGPGPDGTTAHVAGERRDVEAALVLHASLHAQAAARAARERRSTPAATQRWRRAFLFGYADRVGEALRRSNDAAVAERPGAIDDLLPALRARDQRVRELLRERFGRIGAARPASSVSVAAFAAGRSAADAADLGRARVGSRPALGRGGP